MRPLLLVLLAVAALSGCKRDESAARVAKLKAEYAALVDARTAPGAPAFDALAKKLEAIPEDAKAHGEAQRLLQAIRQAQRRAPARPLAREGGEESASAREESRCAALARAMGVATAEQREGLERELAECRKRVERLKIEENRESHPHEH